MLDEAAAEYMGINHTDGRAIDVIDQHGRITAGELARELRLSTGAVTTLVDRLERAGFARRVRDDADRPFSGFAKGFNDEEFEVLHRFQQLSQTWLEERLARVEQLSADKRNKGGDQVAT